MSSILRAFRNLRSQRKQLGRHMLVAGILQAQFAITTVIPTTVKDLHPGGIGAGADVLSQVLLEGRPLREFDPARSVRFFAFSSCIVVSFLPTQFAITMYIP